MERDEPTVYEVDAEGVIRGVGGAWARFANENGGEGLASSQVVGRRLSEFVSDLTTRAIYDRLMERALEGHPVAVHFRCDSPDRRRWMRLQMIPAGPGLRFEVHSEREQVRAPVPLIDPARPVADSLLSMCSWCKRIDAGSAWLEAEAAIEALGLFDGETLPGISHGICPDCLERPELHVA